MPPSSRVLELAQHRTTEVVAAAEGAAEMAAEIEAGPVVERRRKNGRLFVVGAPAEIGAEGGRGGGDGGDGHEGCEDLLHCVGLRKPFGDTLVRGAFHAHAIRLHLSKMLSLGGDSGY